MTSIKFSIVQDQVEEVEGVNAIAEITLDNAIIEIKQYYETYEQAITWIRKLREVLILANWNARL